MRIMGKATIAILLVTLAGCGCLEPISEGPHIRAGATPDPEQSAWHRCLFGTRFVPVVPTYCNVSRSQVISAKQADPTPPN